MNNNLKYVFLLVTNVSFVCVHKSLACRRCKPNMHRPKDIKIICCLLQTIIDHPHDTKYRTIHVNNISKLFENIKLCLNILQNVGFCLRNRNNKYRLIYCGCVNNSIDFKTFTLPRQLEQIATQTLNIYTKIAPKIVNLNQSHSNTGILHIRLIVKCIYPIENISHHKHIYFLVNVIFF